MHGSIVDVHYAVPRRELLGAASMKGRWLPDVRGLPGWKKKPSTGGLLDWLEHGCWLKGIPARNPAGMGRPEWPFTPLGERYCEKNEAGRDPVRKTPVHYNPATARQAMTTQIPERRTV